MIIDRLDDMRRGKGGKVRAPTAIIVNLVLVQPRDRPEVLGQKKRFSRAFKAL